MKCEHCDETKVILYRVFHEAPQSRPLTESYYTYYTWPVGAEMGNKSATFDVAVTPPLCPFHAGYYIEGIIRRYQRMPTPYEPVVI